MATGKIMELQLELAGFEKTVWRRIQIPSNTLMSKLAYIIMSTFEMKASHLFRFDIPEKENEAMRMSRSSYCTQEQVDDFLKNPRHEKYIKHSICEIVSEYTWDYLDPEKTIVYGAIENKIHAFLNTEDQHLLFEYDFGDGWEITITYVREFSDKEIPSHFLPRITDGRGYGIIEDVGGIHGLTEFVQAYKEKQGERYDEYRNWSGFKTFNFEKLDIHEANFRLQKIPKIYAAIYEKRKYPTNKQIDFLERKYN